MKKLILLLLSFTAIIFSYSTYDFYNKKYVAKLDTFETQIGYQEEKKTVPFSVIFQNVDSIQPFIDSLIGYADEKDATVLMISNNNDGDKEQLSYAVYTSHETIVDALKIETTNLINFHDANSNAYFSSNVADAESSGLITSLDRRYFDINTRAYKIGTLQSISPYLTANLGVTLCLYGNDVTSLEQDIVQMVKDAGLQGKVNISSLYEGFSPADSKGINENSNDDVLWILLATYVIIFLLCIIDVSKRQKDIFVMRMHGISVVGVIRKLYVRFMITSVILFTLVLSLSYIWMSNHAVIDTKEVAYALCWFPLILLLCDAVLCVFILLYIKYTVNMNALKAHKDHHQMMYVNIILKIGILICMMPSFLTLLKDASVAFHDNYIIKKNETVLKSFMNYYPSYQMRVQDEQKVFDYFMQNDGEYIDFSKYIYSQRKFLEEQIEDEKEIEMSLIEFPFIYANANYLKSYEIKDVNGNRIDPYSFTEETMLVPLRYKDEQLKRVCFSTDCDIVYIQDTGTFLNYDVNTIHRLSSIHNPVIRIITHLGDESNREYMFLPISDQRGIPEYEQAIQKLGISEITFSTHSEGLQVWFEKNRMICIRFFLLLGMYLCVLIALIYQFAYLCVSDMKRELVLQYMAGKGFMNRTRYVFAICLVPYMIPLCTGIIVQRQPFLQYSLLLSCIAGFEILLLVIMIKRWERHHAVNALKGEGDL